jgi:hypothetical protein
MSNAKLVIVSKIGDFQKITKGNFYIIRKEV